MRKIHRAAKLGWIATLKNELRRGVAIDAIDPITGSTPLHFACQCGQEEAAIYLIKKGANVHLSNRNRWHPLVLSAYHGLYSVVKLLLESSVGPQESGNNHTALHAAVDKGFFRISRLLIQNGADVNARDIGGSGDRAPLHYAVDRENVRMVEILVAGGANVDIPDLDGATPLIQAAAFGNISIACILLNAAADVNIQIPDGSTPLHFASVYDKEKLIRLLLRNGANPDILNKRGKTPLDAARECGAEKAIRILTTFQYCNKWECGGIREP